VFLTIAAAFAGADRDRVRETLRQMKADQKSRGRYVGGKVGRGSEPMYLNQIQVVILFMFCVLIGGLLWPHLSDGRHRKEKERREKMARRRH
jgi:hypothetical protein